MECLHDLKNILYIPNEILIPGWREAITIKHLALGHNLMSQVGVEPAILRLHVQHLNQYATILLTIGSHFATWLPLPS